MRKRQVSASAETSHTKNVTKSAKPLSESECLEILYPVIIGDYFDDPSDEQVQALAQLSGKDLESC